MEQPVTLALVGAGNRGAGVFGQYALDMPHRARFTAVAEPDPARRAAFAAAHGISAGRCFACADDFFARPALAEAVVIATQESERERQLRGAMAAGYHILVEKPLGTTPEEVVRVCDAARAYGRLFIVCHQLRHVASYGTVKALLASGDYGRPVAVQHAENLSWHHMAHSFVRGFFNSDRLTPMILAKSCHDFDLLRYLVDRRPRRVASFGALDWFRPENAPAGAPARCLDGCPAAAECPYHVLKIYFSDDTDPAYLRQIGVVRDRAHLLELLAGNRFGRCVFRCDNDVVDHQSVQVEFEGGVTASFTMTGHNWLERRTTKISLTNGEIEYDGARRTIRAYTFSPPLAREIHPQGMAGSHGGGDRRIMDAFLDGIRGAGDGRAGATAVGISLDGHLLAFAAEAARREGRVIEFDDYERRVRRQAAGEAGEGA